MSTRIDISDQVTPALQQMGATLADRRDINENIGMRVETLCKRYVQQDAGSRHKSASALGAGPTGFLGGAVEGISSSSDEYGIDIDFRHFWFAAVGHDVDLRASDYGHKLFTIPADAEAYGHRIMIGGGQPRFPGGFWKKSKEGGVPIYVMPDGNGGLKTLYIGTPKIHQPQDRTRLPSDEEIAGTAKDELKSQLKQRVAALSQ